MTSVSANCSTSLAFNKTRMKSPLNAKLRLICELLVRLTIWLNNLNDGLV